MEVIVGLSDIAPYPAMWAKHLSETLTVDVSARRGSFDSASPSDLSEVSAVGIAALFAEPETTDSPIQPASELCADCERLGLSVDKFIINRGDGNHSLPGSLDASQLSLLGSGSVYGSTSSNLASMVVSRLDLSREVSHGWNGGGGSARRALTTFGHTLDGAGHCRFCSLICQAVQRYTKGGVRPETTLSLTWEVDGRQVTRGRRHINCTRRIHLSWPEKGRAENEDLYLVFVAPSEPGPANGVVADGKHFLGRELVKPEEKLDLMKSWIDLCCEKHGKNCHRKHGNEEDFEKLIKSTYFGVIDVESMRLTALPVDRNGKPERYVALSYVWGKGTMDHQSQYPTYPTRRANVMLRIQPGGLQRAWDQIPKTIQDVILLVRKMGERFVWIDSLCIVQDSNTSWELNAKAMHLVYGHAHFTICAADGDTTTGLKAARPVLRSSKAAGSTTTFGTKASKATDRRNGVRVKVVRVSGEDGLDEGVEGDEGEDGGGDSSAQTNADADSDAEDDHLSIPLTAECLPGIKLLVSRPPEAVVQNSLWNQRGWTFQERLLSPRCLIFAEGQMYFQCRSAVMSQDIFTDGGAHGWSLDWTNSPLRTLGELRRRAFWFYMKCIRLYTGRELTKPKDILTAFQGTSWLLKQHLNAPLFYGLPTSHFDLALLWMPLQALRRRKRKAHRGHGGVGVGCTQDEFGNCRCNLEEEGYGGKEFPSWSWCGWMGGKAAYRLDMLEGCLLNVQEWLRNHTWILWYVRDLEGNLRPLWDRNIVGEDKSVEARWRGYAGRNSYSAPPAPSSASLDGPSATPLPRRSSIQVSPRPVPAASPRPQGLDPSAPLQYDSGAPTPLPSSEQMPEPLAVEQELGQPRPLGLNRGVPAPLNLSGPVLKKTPSPTPPAKRHRVAFPAVEAETSDGWLRQSNAAYLSRLPPGYYDQEQVTFGAHAQGQPLDSDAARQSRPASPPQTTGGGAAQSLRQRASVRKKPIQQLPGPPSRPPMRQRPSTRGVGRDSAANLGPPVDARNRWSRLTVDASGSAATVLGNATSPGLPSSPGSDAARSPQNQGRHQHSLEHDPEHGELDPGEYSYDEHLLLSDADGSDHDGAGSVTSRHRQDRRPERLHQPAKPPPEDPYGRPVRRNAKPGTKFTGILPDNPFGVVRGPYSTATQDKDWLDALPILQFWTWRTELYVSVREPWSGPKPSSGSRGSLDGGAKDHPNNDQGLPGTADEEGGEEDGGGGLCQCDVVDRAGDWCGSILLTREWLAANNNTVGGGGGGSSSPLNFIAIGDAKGFTDDECPVWNYYIPKEKDESEWDLYYVLLLERNWERALWERVALGKVFHAAFAAARWDEIKLG